MHARATPHIVQPTEALSATSSHILSPEVIDILFIVQDQYTQEKREISENCSFLQVFLFFLWFPELVSLISNLLLFFREHLSTYDQ